MGNEKFVTKEDCSETKSAILNAINKLEIQYGRIDEALNGKMGVVVVIKDIRDEQKNVNTKLNNVENTIKKNGKSKLTGRDKAVIYGSIATALVVAIGSVIVAYLQLIK